MPQEGAGAAHAQRNWMALTVRPGDARPSSGGARGAALTALLACAATVGGIAAVGTGVHWPSDLAPVVRAKYEHFEREKDAYDVAYFGSSNLFRTLIPAEIDRRLAAAGHPVRSFNFAVPGMSRFETDHLIRRAVALGPGRLRWAVVELGDWEPGRMGADVLRSISWHSTRQTLNALHSVALRDLAPGKTLEFGWPHVRAWLLHHGNFGYGPFVVRDLFDMPPPELVEARGWVALEDGFRALDDETRASAKRRNTEFLATLDRYHAEVAALRDGSAAPHRPPYNVRALRSQVAFLREHGIEPVYFVAPHTQATPRLERLATDGDIPALVRLNRPGAYPELYAQENRFDRTHVRRSGAVLASVIFADAFAELMGEDD